MTTATGAGEQPRADSGPDEAGDPGQAGGTGAAGVADDREQRPGITVAPPVFKLVDFEADVIAEVAAGLCQRIGLATDPPIRIEIDETIPLGRAGLTSVEPTVLSIESGAMEDLHRPRQLGSRAANDVMGRLLMRVRDRRDPAFGDPPGEDDLSLAQSTAWDVYAMGRLGRLGQTVQRPRWQYHFRLRHGFSDRSDAAFVQLWEADGLTWPDIERISAATS